MGTDTHLRLTKQTNILELETKLRLAQGIIKEGGRTSIVRSICGISKASAIQLHYEVMGSPPIAGMLPSDPEWIVKSPLNNLHGSAFYLIFKKIYDTCETSKAGAYLNAYLIYKDTLRNRQLPLDINRAWHIVQQISMNTIGAKQCDRCCLHYVYLHEYPAPYRFCPVCDSEQDTAGRLRYKQYCQRQPANTKPSQGSKGRLH